MKNTIIFTLFVGICLFSACKEEDPIVPPFTYSSGIFVLNEGLFQSGNASVSFLDRASQSVTENIFMKANANPLGDVLQSMYLFGDRAFLVLNNSAKVEVVKADDFTALATITGFSSPRYFLPVSLSKAYVSDWISNSLKIIDLNTNTITGSISVGEGPEELLLHNGLVFIANSGGFGIDSSVSVVNPQTDQVVSTIACAKGPTGLGVDANGSIWAICRGDYGDFGDPNDDIAGSLIRIDPNEMTMEAQFNFGQQDHPMKMAMSNDANHIWFLNNGLRKMHFNDSQLPATAFSPHYFYGIGVDPNNGTVYCADPVDYVQKGWVHRFSQSGYPLDSFRVEYVPNGFVFR